MEKGNKFLIHVVGGGLAGCEAAWQIAQANQPVVIYESRPFDMSECHRTEFLAELVCSNSFKSERESSAPGCLKREMRHFNSLTLDAADKTRIPAGEALAVDRELFSAYISEKISQNPLIEVERRQIRSLIPQEQLETESEAWIIATGPLTSGALAQSLGDLCGDHGNFYFYDAIAPILDADSIDFDACFYADRYGKESIGDYLNVPLDKVEYETLIDAILDAEKVPLQSFEEPKYFEACLPIEVMAERGRDTLRFGPFKPVGLVSPISSSRPYANIQLRRENKSASSFGMVGCQTKMKWPEQKRIFRSLEAFREVEFFRYGSIHRNSYVCGPKVLCSDLSFKKAPNIFLAGQLTGVEGYVESAALGLLAGHFAMAKLKIKPFVPPPIHTLMGGLLDHVTRERPGAYSPMNANLGLLPNIERKSGMSKLEKKQLQCFYARKSFDKYMNSDKETGLVDSGC